MVEYFIQASNIVILNASVRLPLVEWAKNGNVWVEAENGIVYGYSFSLVFIVPF